MGTPHALPEPADESALDLLPGGEPTHADDDAANTARALAPTNDPLRLYVRQIGDGPLLTRDEERELARRKDAGTSRPSGS